MAQGGGAGYDDSRPVGVPERFVSPPPGEEADAEVALGSDAAGAVSPEAASAGLERLRARDPNFDPDAFTGSLETLFFVVQEAWMECRPELARSVMSGPLLDATLARLAEYARAKQRRMLEDIALGEADVVAVRSDSRQDTVTVRFRVASADYDIDAATGRPLRGDREVREHWEDWTFQRAAGALTPPGGGTMNRHCPNCQAPLSIDEAGDCTYCRQPVMNGRYDWVLTRIEGASPS